MKNDLVKLFEETFGRLPQAVTCAPGRIEFIGNHTDYNGGLVLGAAIDRSVKVAVARREDDRIHLKSLMETQDVQTSLSSVIRQTGARFWANYPLGVLESLKQDGLLPDKGFDLLVTSDVHPGAGLSSSAAFELASALAFSSIYNFPMTRERLVMAARRAENEFVGVPCGILDQAVSCFGKEDHLVLIDCKQITFTTVPLPKGVNFWIFNTNVKHNLVTSLYATRHQECMEAVRLIKQSLPEIDCLADVTPKQLKAHLHELPKKIGLRARHVVEENQRVKDTIAALAKGDLRTVGTLLLASHESSRKLFENSCPELDTFVDLLKKRAHVFGARLTGGGFGGAVMAMTGPEFTEVQASEVAADFAARYNNCCPAIFHAKTGDGAHVV
ncbi:MAG: galactokinase [Verrucomicrobiota bacterium]|nr:galactokinase [Verrucomicrobiota bacterium]